MWAQPSPPLCHSPTRFTTPRGAPWHPTGWQLFFGSWPLLHPASPHLTPEGGTQGSDPHLELVFSSIANATLNSGAIKDKLLLHNTNTAMPKVKGMEDKSLLASKSLRVSLVCMHKYTVSANAYDLKNRRNNFRPVSAMSIQ